jgi:hypothetical protein
MFLSDPDFAFDYMHQLHEWHYAKVGYSESDRSQGTPARIRLISSVQSNLSICTPVSLQSLPKCMLFASTKLGSTLKCSIYMNCHFAGLFLEICTHLQSFCA